MQSFHEDICPVERSLKLSEFQIDQTASAVSSIIILIVDKSC